MGELYHTTVLQGDIGEIMFEHYCLDHNYAYIKLEDVYNTLTPNNKLTFKHGYERITVTIPDENADEVRRICKPKGDDSDPSFVYDYLTVSLWSNFKFDGHKHNQHSAPIKKLRIQWVEVKTNTNQLSPRQKAVMKTLKLPLCVFRIHLKLPKTHKVDWEETYRNP